MAKEKFKSKGGFILASIGAAVGLGNALRFPGMCAKYGGGAFLFVYFVALILLGVPLLNAEIALGRKFSGGAPKCMAKLVRGGERLGWASCVNSVFTAIIYAGLAGWLIAAAINFVPLANSSAELTQSQISEYFFKEVLSARSDGVISGISPLVCVLMCAVWGLMYACLRGGAETLARAAKFTVIIPVVLLLFMTVRGLAYENSLQALGALFLPDFTALSSPELWLGALGQVFFSLSVAVGIMPAYGSYLPEGTNIFSCSLIIAAADFLVSVLASVVMFTTLYGCGLQNQISQSGIITAFAVYPSALASLFGNNAVLNSVAGVLFYCSLTMLAVQSAVSMAEAFVSPFAAEFGKNKKKVAACVCAAGGIISIFYATTAAVTVAEISDRFVNFYNVLLLGTIECIFVGYGKERKTLPSEINRFTNKLKIPSKFFGVSVKILSPAVLIPLSVYETVRLFTNSSGYPVWAQFAFGWGVSLSVFAAGMTLGRLLNPRDAVLKLKSGKNTVNFM